MAGEQLLSTADALAEFPDNQSGLIEAVNARNNVLSVAVGIGFQVASAPFTIPIVSGVPVSINAAIGAHEFLANFFIEDGNNSLVSEYPVGVTIAPDLARLAGIVAVIDVEKAGGGTDTYTFQAYKSGAPVGGAQSILLGTSPTNVTLSFELAFLPAAVEPIEIRVTGEGTGDDIEAVDFRMRVTSIQI